MYMLHTCQGPQNRALPVAVTIKFLKLSTQYNRVLIKCRTMNEKKGKTEEYHLSEWISEGTAPKKQGKTVNFNLFPLLLGCSAF
jgi:hypothetical protein